MWLADNWTEYEVLDTSSGEKSERWGDVVLVRPDPQVIWKTKRTHPSWKHWDGLYHRSAKGGGSWESHGMPDEWSIRYKLPLEVDTPGESRWESADTDRPSPRGEGGCDSSRMRCPTLTFNLKPFSFKHTGLFPEQAANWDWFTPLIKEKRKVLNLFAYTGGATLAAAAAGAQVTHVDASKGMVGWAKENAAASGLSDAPIRWLVDDCVKFVEREIRRGNKYDAIIMDPPSYGRGPKGETWKIEDNVFELIRRTSLLLSDTPLFFLISSYTTGLQPGVLRQMLQLVFDGDNGDGSVCHLEEQVTRQNRPQLSPANPRIEADELGLPVTTGGILPCGASGRVTF